MWSDLAANTNLLLGFTFVTVFEVLLFLCRFILGSPQKKAARKIPHVGAPIPPSPFSQQLDRSR